MKLGDHQSQSVVKLLLLGDSKSGKTGSLVSLVAAGYKLRILDFDNLLDILSYKVREICPDLIDNVEFRSLRDPITATPGGSKINGRPKAWLESIKMLNNWKYDDVDLGPPSQWGPDCVLVIDSLTRWCDACYDCHEVITPPAKGGALDGFAVYRNAQDDMEKQLASLTSPTFAINVIVICHGKYMDMPDGTKKIFPQGIGKALSPLIPTYFPNFIHYKMVNGKRIISLESDNMIALSTTRPNEMPKTLPIETGLADFFAILRDSPAKKSSPKAVTPIRKL
jgi:hypothetical protein